MNNFSLNQVVRLESGWSCVVFDCNQINLGNVYINFEDFNNMPVATLENISFRVYSKSKKVVVSSVVPVEFDFCALDFNYSMWKCIHCKKINRVSDANCFCSTYSNCWTPINGSISSVIFSNKFEFKYHFEDNTLSNIII
jgi:hypothetical protein